MYCRLGIKGALAMALIFSLVPLLTTLSLAKQVSFSGSLPSQVGLRDLLSQGNIGDLAFSPDGSNIVFTLSDDNQASLWTIRTDGRRLTQLARLEGSIVRPSFSPDGRTVAFMWAHDDKSSLVLLNVLINSLAVVGQDAKVDSFAWSPSSTSVVYSDELGGRISIVDIRSLRNSEVNTGMESRQPVFVKDNTIAFSGRSGSTFSIWLKDLDNGRLTRLTYAGNDSFPLVSPAGDQVLYMRRSESGTSFGVVDLRSFVDRQLFYPNGMMIEIDGRPYLFGSAPPELDPSFLPKWSPDGKYVLFLVKPNTSSTNLYLATLNVTVKFEYNSNEYYVQTDLYGPVQQAGASVKVADWSPDGKSIALFSASLPRGRLQILLLEPSKVKPIGGYGGS